MQHNAPEEPEYALSSMVLGAYPDLIYEKGPNKGYPYYDDPKYAEMSKDLAVFLKLLIQRFSDNPITYIKWYFLGKPATYWSPSMIAGAGGSFIYPVKTSLYSISPLMGATDSVWRYIHYFLIITGAIYCFYVTASFLLRMNFSNLNIGVAMVLTGSCIYFTSVHMVFAPLPRYSIPVHPVMYLVAMLALRDIYVRAIK